MSVSSFFFFNDTATTEIYTLSLHDALPISRRCCFVAWVEVMRMMGVWRPSAGVCSSAWHTCRPSRSGRWAFSRMRSEEHTSELQSRLHLVCRLLLEKKNSTHNIRVLLTTSA